MRTPESRWCCKPKGHPKKVVKFARHKAQGMVICRISPRSLPFLTQDSLTFGWDEDAGFAGCCISRLAHPDAAREEAHSDRDQAGTVEPTSKHGIGSVRHWGGIWVLAVFPVGKGWKRCSIVVVSNIFEFSTRTLGMISNLTNIFQMGWNHQLVCLFSNVRK